MTGLKAICDAPRDYFTNHFIEPKRTQAILDRHPNTSPDIKRLLQEMIDDYTDKSYPKEIT